MYDFRRRARAITKQLRQKSHGHHPPSGLSEQEDEDYWDNISKDVEKWLRIAYRCGEEGCVACEAERKT